MFGVNSYRYIYICNHTRSVLDILCRNAPQAGQRPAVANQAMAIYMGKKDTP